MDNEEMQLMVATTGLGKSSNMYFIRPNVVETILSFPLKQERMPWESKYSGTGGVGSGTKDSKKTSPKMNHTGNGYRAKRKKQSR